MNINGLLRLKRSPTAGELAGRTTDPRFYSALTILPNPDPVLRKLGMAENIFEGIQSDAHVIGELRATKSSFERFEHRLVRGGDDAKSLRALELCQTFLDRAPAPMFTWPDVHWNIGSATYRGYSVHEIVWQQYDKLWMPASLEHRPNRRFAFNVDSALRVLTREQPFEGVPAEDGKFLVMRHMPSFDNPYGVALFSSCFWPYTFKHAGFRWFVKFCERYSIPFLIGKYPAGTPEPDIKKLEEALESMIESAYAAIQDGGGIETVESKAGGVGTSLPQQSMIQLCNSEMSKALTSQTLATEQPGSGSRAAAETHRGRELDTNAGDREKIAFTLDQLWRWITFYNVGPDAKPPTSEFHTEEKVTKDRAEIHEIFNRVAGGASRQAMADELGITLAAKSEDAIARAVAPNTGAASFARADTSGFADQDAIDQVDLDERSQSHMDALLKPLIDDLRKGLTGEQLLARLTKLYPEMNDAALEQLLTRAIFVADVWGRLSAEASRGDDA